MSALDLIRNATRPICRNIFLNGRRTSIRMERITWDALEDVCRIEDRSLSEIVGLIDRRRGANGLTPSIRLFVIAYFHALSHRFSRLMEQESSLLPDPGVCAEAALDRVGGWGVPTQIERFMTQDELKSKQENQSHSG